MKFLAILLLTFFISLAHAEDLLVPISKFHNDSQQLGDSKVLEFWVSHDYQGSDNYQNDLRIRYYNPLEVGDWKGRIRLDANITTNYNSISTPNNSGAYSEGNMFMTVWGQAPEFLQSLKALVGARIIFPFGNNGQWAAGPQIGWRFIPEVDATLKVTDFSPLLRYIYGWDANNNSFVVNPTQPALARNLHIFPTIGFQLAPNTTLRFWDENGAVFNTAGNGWFIPIDVMVLHRLDKNWVVAVGASKQVVQSYQQYDWSTYAKISFNF
jgi:hypothetical protein